MINVFSVSPTIQAVFDALKAVLAEDPNYTNVNSFASKDAGGTGQSITITDKYGSTATYSERITTGRVFLDPTSASLGPGETQTFAATTLDGNGAPVPATVTWSLQAGALGSVDAAGVYTAPATITATSLESLTAKDAADASATASISLHP
jgi:hypothetical protein